MFDIGFWELLVIAVVALLVAGPERLPELLRDVSRWVAKLRRLALQTRHEFEQQLRLDEVKNLNEKVEELDKLMEIAPDKRNDEKPKSG